MYDLMCIDEDETNWILSQPVDPAEIMGASKPLAISVTYPLNGIVLVAVKAAASVALLPRPKSNPPWPWGWIPGGGGIQLPPALIYLPASGRPVNDPFELPASTNLATLRGQLTTAMTAGTRVEVAVGSVGQDGVLVLNGAVLPFVALFPSQKPPALPS